MQHSLLRYRLSPGARAPIGWLLPVAVAVLYHLLARGSRWDRFYELALAFAFAVYVATFVAGRVRNMALPVAALFFCLAAAECYALLQATPTIEIDPPGYAGERPNLGWGPQRAGVFHATKLDGRTRNVIYDVDYTIDENLNRRVISAASGATIAFFGDSMTFGQGLPDVDTLPQAFANATDRGYRVLDFGVPGYGPQQFLRALETDMYKGLLAETRLFVMLTASWHAERANCGETYMWHAPRYVLAQGVPSYQGQCSDDWYQHVRKLWTRTAMDGVFFKPVFGGPRAADIDLYIAILSRAGQLAREKYGAPTLILYLSDGEYIRRAGTTDEQIRQRLREAGLLVAKANLDPKDFPGETLAIPGDGHPTGVANRVRALLVRSVLAGLPVAAR